MVYEAGLTLNDLRSMNLGQALDFAYTYIEFHKPKGKKVDNKGLSGMREATPEETRLFLGGS